ncbi:MAG: T9SS type A sorting domain-containing protein, partial [Dysgonamonadaceae bacterium]|nr:T9SS type A sorting domain-containing protein [Dysgonamonadaceae bacterium]
YEWFRNGSPAGENNSILSGLGEGYYRIRITDANGISIESEEIFLDEPEKLSIVTSAADLRCSLDTNGWAQAIVSGGTFPYHFSWSNGANSPRIENIPKGKYFILVTDANGCEITENVSIVQAGGIVAKAELIPPTCHNGTNGAINIDISGGEAPYSFEWNNGLKSLNHTGLPAGNYSITITDANHCSHEIFYYTLSHPDSIIIDLGKDITLCDGQSLQINARSDEEVKSYAWFNPYGLKISDKQDITLQEPGMYRVEILTEKGCKGAGNIKIDREHRKIANDFLIASQVPINDEIFVVNISDPAPDKIEWILPDGEGSNFEIVSNDENILSLIFKQYGTFTIGMITYSGNCTETVYKAVLVTDKENIANYEEADEPVLKSFSVFPNPNPGYFETLIEVKDDNPVILQLVNSGSGKVTERRTLKGKKIYKESFNITGNEKGTYILNLYTLQSRSVKKVIIK